MFKKLFQLKRRNAAGPDGWRAYVVGDVHGRLDLLDHLLGQIALDHAGRPTAKGLIVLLGDLIDRGPDSKGVLERAAGLELPGFKTVVIGGNHEEVLSQLLDGDPQPLESWLRFGGAETLQSYGLDPAAIGGSHPDTALARIGAAIPTHHRDLLANAADSLRFGDYLFVHAGLRPGVPLEQQSLRDLRWIREPFLSDPRDHGMTVVHGHTITDRVEMLGSRVGVDTGAYLTGRLTALAIEGPRRWVIDTIDGLQDDA